jgi:hypothetical protein
VILSRPPAGCFQSAGCGRSRFSPVLARALPVFGLTYLLNN